MKRNKYYYLPFGLVAGANAINRFTFLFNFGLIDSAAKH